jgi:hypothetical protein
MGAEFFAFAVFVAMFAMLQVALENRIATPYWWCECRAVERMLENL